jgi:Na+-driven multidrug efflux pump
VFGAALATLIAFAVTGALLGYAAVRRRWIAWVRGVDWTIVRRVLRIGTPVSVHGIAFSAVYVFIVRETNRAGGDPATAALGLGLRLEGFAYMASVGFATAAAAVVGQNLGARRPARAQQAAWTAVRIAGWISGIWGLFFIAMPESLADWMTPGPVTAAHALNYFRIVAVSLVFTAAEIVLEGAFSGAGDTRPALVLALPLTVVRIPAAFVAVEVFGMGVAGIFWALTWTSVVRGLALMFWFARNRWIHGTA